MVLFWRACLALYLVAPPLLADGLGPHNNPHNKDFSGHWELDYQLSDHPSEKIQRLYIQARSEARRQAERAQNTGRFVDPQIFNLQPIIGLGRLTEKIAQATVLDVTQAEDHVVIRRNDDYALICDFTNLGWKQSPVGTEGCTWDEDQLVFQVALPEGLNVFHRLSIAADRSRLNVATTVTVDGVRYPFTLNRVYMPYEPGQGMYNCEFTIATQTTCTLRGSEN